MPGKGFLSMMILGAGRLGTGETATDPDVSRNQHHFFFGGGLTPGCFRRFIDFRKARFAARRFCLRLAMSIAPAYSVHPI